MARRNPGGALVAIGAILFLCLIVGSCSIPLWTQDTVTVKVTEKERITTGSGESITSKYLVFTETETFENTDVLILGKFDSSDVQGSIQPGETYRLRVYGWRVPFLSWYRNIIEGNRVGE
ncbi:MAG: hypothetical protein CMJ75_18785 [Planctomycetaceae bacterium]|nr:hypothetical protein [Planctomycetaceae bacterium]